MATDCDIDSEWSGSVSDLRSTDGSDTTGSLRGFITSANGSQVSERSPSHSSSNSGNDLLEMERELGGSRYPPHRSNERRSATFRRAINCSKALNNAIGRTHCIHAIHVEELHLLLSVIDEAICIIEELVKVACSCSTGTRPGSCVSYGENVNISQL